jgi:hypothetical protein
LFEIKNTCTELKFRIGVREKGHEIEKNERED